MKISIITVCFNSQDTIKDTLESVLQQTYKNYEYLIIDGKSTDNTLDIVKSYEKRFKGKMRIVSEKDKGLYDAMNKGVKLASGDIIGIINSDDTLAHKDVFKNVIDNINNHDGVYSNLLMLDKYLVKPYRLLKSKKVSKKLGWHMPHPTLYLRKKVYNQYGYFNLDHPIAADLDIMFRLINNNVDLKYIDDYFVFMRSGGASTNGLRGYYKNFKDSYNVLKENNRPLPLLTNIYRIFEMYTERIKAKICKNDIFKAKHISNKPIYIQINTVCNGSTGKIMGDIARQKEKEGYQTLCIYGRRKGYNDLNCIKVGGFFSFWWHVILNTLFDSQGRHGSYFKTKKIVNILKQENPDIIHLHNIHGYYLNYPVLFKYLRDEFKGEVKWTFHDCWPITGHCAFFTYANCSKWKKQCDKCPNKKKYPISLLFDNSNKNYLIKKKCFTSLDKLTIITPSDWLNSIVKQSFLKKYDVVTINNTIDTNIFKPTKDDSVIEKYSLPRDKKIILGVANNWEERKGLNDFIKLSNQISDDYRIVLVGVNNKQKRVLKQYNIIGIKRTDNQYELAVLYTFADVFVNPTYEDNYPTVNLEAIACGTKVITYDTGGCKEQINEKNGYLTTFNDLFKTITEVTK